ncbi:MAG: TrkA family potassium uptake protein [Proteobacteria bacterium]|nr:TrkA family potassium uptake protein [Pseudomonadota bacterium]
MRPLGSLALVWLVGAVLHHAFGAAPGAPDSGWSDAFFVSYNLLFMEHLTDLPAHPVGQAVQYIQPLFGIFLLAEGLVKLGITVFRKEDNQERWMSILASTTSGHIILCGLGNVGFRVLEELAAMGHQVFVVELDDSCPSLDRARELGAEVLIGDARAENTLRSLNVHDARALIVATDDDLANLEIAMDARETDSEIPIVLRLFDQRLARKVQSSLGIQVSFSTSKLAAPLLAGAALDTAVVGAHRVGDQVLVVMDLEVAGLAGMKLSELAGTHGLTTIAVMRDGAWNTRPAIATKLAIGDRVQLLAASDRLDEVRALNAV